MSATSEVPRQLGRYEVLRVLGEGSMGRVYLAREDNPLREVAVKLLRSALLPVEFEQRFRREIDLLGRLEHPGIARLYAAGRLDTGGSSLPYLAMEYVDGTDLLSHANAAALDTDSKLRLLAAVARAVHHAHTRGVIHRDLKPTNILVDGSGQPKVLDFGVAHVVDAGETQMTQVGQVLGTLPYMSPEQLGSQGVDPRSDVYALGCIGYELLSGQLPHPGLSKASLMAAAEVVRTHTPVRLARLAPDYAGDVETIIHKAMSFEPGQRYQSAAELAADLERFLARQPIAARPPTVLYVAGLFVRRHRALSIGVVLALLAIVGGSLISLKFALDARTRLAELTAVSKFLQDMLISADPDRALGKDVRVMDAIDAAERELSSQSDLPRAAEAAVRRVIGRTRSRLGDPAAGLPLLEQAVGVADREHGANSDEAREARLDLARGYEDAGEYARMGTVVADPSFSGEVPDAQRARAMTIQTISLLGTGALDEAVKQGEAAYAWAVDRLGPDASLTHDAAYALINVQRDAGLYAPAIAKARELLASHARLYAPEHPRLQAVENLLGSLLELNDELPEAEKALRGVLAKAEKVYGKDHYLTGDYRLNLGLVLAKQQRYTEAVALIEVTRAVYVQRFGQANTRTLAALNAEATYREELGQMAEAEAGLREILRIQQELGIRGMPHLAPRSNLGTLLRNQRRYTEAHEQFSLVMQQAAQDIGKEHPLYGLFLSKQGWNLALAGRRDEARSILRESLERLTAGMGADSGETLKVKGYLDQIEQGGPKS